MSNLDRFNLNLHLSHEQYKKYEEFRIKHKKPSKLIFEFDSGIGINILVKSGKDKLDLTDYNNW